MDSTGRRDSGPAVCQSHRVPLDCAVCLARHSRSAGSDLNRDTASNTVRGEWIQPGGEILDPQYASPIEFHSIAPSVWRGTVVPLDQRISLYIFISSKDGKMTATISN